jgi:hypothetical protein
MYYKILRSNQIHPACPTFKMLSSFRFLPNRVSSSFTVHDFHAYRKFQINHFFYFNIFMRVYCLVLATICIFIFNSIHWKGEDWWLLIDWSTWSTQNSLNNACWVLDILCMEIRMHRKHKLYAKIKTVTKSIYKMMSKLALLNYSLLTPQKERVKT